MGAMDDSDAPRTQSSTPRERRRRTIVIVSSAVAVLAVVVLLAIGLMNQGIDSTIQDALDAGDRPDAPELALPVFTAGDGIGPVDAPFDLRDARGKVVVLNFWASWCPPCEAEAPILEGVARGYRQLGKDVVVIGVDVEDVPSSAREFIRTHEVSYPNLRDRGDDVKRRFEVGNLPETFVIDQSGRIAVKQVARSPRRATPRPSSSCCARTAADEGGARARLAGGGAAGARARAGIRRGLSVSEVARELRCPTCNARSTPRTRRRPTT